MPKTKTPSKPAVSTVNVRVDRDLWAALSTWADEYSPKTTPTALLDHLLRGALAEHEQPGSPSHRLAR